MQYVSLLIILAVIVPSIGGCAAASIVGDVAGQAVDTTQQLFRAGKADTYLNARWEDVTGATRKAAEKLAMHYHREVDHPEQVKYVVMDDREQKVTITVVRRTALATELHVDVGLFGPEGLGRLVLREIAHQMPGALADQRLNAEVETTSEK